MPVYAVHIQKEIEYFGAARPAGNTYHFEAAAGTDFDDEAAALDAVAAERAITANVVNFTGWRSWGPVDGPEFDNVMRADGTLTGTGSVTTAAMYREVCALFVWPISRSPLTNRKRWLRKFIRMGSGGLTLSSSQLAGEVALTDTQRQTLLDLYAIPVTVVGPGEAFPLCAPDGSKPVANAEVRPYFFTRQIGQ